MDIVETIISSLTGVIVGLATIKFSHEIAEFLSHAPLVSHARDANNPVTYKILGGILIFYSVVMLFL